METKAFFLIFVTLTFDLEVLHTKIVYFIIFSI